MNVRQMIVRLEQMPQDAIVCGTWDMCFWEARDIFKAPNGVVVIDVSDRDDMEDIISGALVPEGFTK